MEARTSVKFIHRCKSIQKFKVWECHSEGKEGPAKQKTNHKDIIRFQIAGDLG